VSGSCSSLAAFDQRPRQPPGRKTAYHRKRVREAESSRSATSDALACSTNRIERRQQLKLDHPILASKSFSIGACPNDTDANGSPPRKHLPSGQILTGDRRGPGNMAVQVD
jgi:hypothetical protein